MSIPPKSSEQPDKQGAHQNTRTPELTRHQYIQQYPHNKKITELRQPIHNAIQTYKTKFQEPYISQLPATSKYDITIQLYVNSL